MKFNPYSLRFKLLLASTVVEALMLSYLLLNSMRLIDQAMLASTDAALMQTAPMLDVATAPYLAQGDYATLQDNLNEIVGKVDQGLSYIVVYDVDGRAVARAGVDDPNTLPPPSKDLRVALSGALLHIARPLSLAGQRVGSLRFGLSTRIIAMAKSSVLQQSGMIALAEIVLTFLLLSVLGFWLTRNLLTFVESSRAVADGRYDLRVPEGGRDEVAKLARNFNRMSAAVERKVRELQASEQRLRELSERLESRVEERSRELQQAAAQIAETERLASLGRVVAGVAHELNTPIGNVVLMASVMEDRIEQLAAATGGKTLTRALLGELIAALQDANQLTLRSGRRAGDLIESFKRVAVDQTSRRRRRFDLREMLQDITNTMGTQLRHAKVDVELTVAEGIELDSVPGHFEHVFTNLIANSIVHGFEGRPGGRIVISAERQSEQVVIVYSDDGHGIAKDLQHRVFEPFYTSKLGQGGSGLGLFIVHNLVCSALGGHLQLDSDTGRGVRFVFHIPLVTPETAPTDLHELPPPAA